MCKTDNIFFNGAVWKSYIWLSVSYVNGRRNSNRHVLVYGLITKEGIGYGDGIMFMCLGTVLGASQNLRLLFLSLICATAAGCIYALVLKKGMKTEIPFIPCILCSYIFMTALRVFV